MYSYTTQSARNLNVPAFPYCNNSALYNMIMLMRRKTHTNKHIIQSINFLWVHLYDNKYGCAVKSQTPQETEEFAQFL